MAEGDKKVVSEKKRVVKFLVWVGIDVGIMVLLAVLLLWRPGGFHSPEVAETDEVSSYLTHVLAPAVYNGVGKGVAFEVKIDEAGINEVVSQMGWPRAEGEVLLLTPAVTFLEGEVKIMATAMVRGVELVVTVIARPAVNSEGLLETGVEGIYIGAMNVTPIARMVGKRTYEENFAAFEEVSEGVVDLRDWGAVVAKGIFMDEAIEPVIRIDDETARIISIEAVEGKMVIGFEPVRPERGKF